MNINDIFGRNIFVPSGKDERMIGALNRADFPFYHNFVNIESYNSARRGILKTSPM